MKPAKWGAAAINNNIGGIYATNFGARNTVASVSGSVKKLGLAFSSAIVVCYDKRTLTAIKATKPDINGGYFFYGLNNSLKCFVVAFDQNEQYNAVIQDMVVPK